jgi:rod shape determining protein RodA
MSWIFRVDWVLLGSAILITLLGILSMHGFGTTDQFASRQLIWLSIGILAFFITSHIDWRFLRRTSIVVIIYGLAILLLGTLFIIGSTFQGAQSWLDLGFFSIQPADPAKLALIIVLAKYFSRRHIEIAQFKHIVVSGAYAFLLFLLIFLQPDFGSALVILGIWGGVILLAGIPIRQLAVLVGIGVVALVFLWTFAFADYQKDRILTFLHPLADIQGAGYNAFQSTVAVGSGGILGKGVGYGTQSRLQFLPEHETDFIFAAFTEEWGMGGALILFILFGTLFMRLINAARIGATNFETLFTLGVAVLFTMHITVHIGMNIGLMPVTGIPLPFMSYGGSHIVTSYAMLGIVSAMRRYGSVVHRDTRHEVVGI